MPDDEYFVAFKLKSRELFFFFTKYFIILFRWFVYSTNYYILLSGRASVFVLPNEAYFSACSRTVGRCLLFSLCFLSSKRYISAVLKCHACIVLKHKTLVRMLSYFSTYKNTF